MAHSVQRHGNSVIPFDNCKSYVFCNLPERQKDYNVHDRLGRSPEEIKFLDAFERLFYAAAQGDLKKCQAIIEEEKFADIDAYSIGKFTNQGDEKSLDCVSPRLVAEMKGHNHISKYFTKRFGSGTQPLGKPPMLILTPKNIKTYEFYLAKYKAMSDDLLIQHLRQEIASTYTFKGAGEFISFFAVLEAMNLEQLSGVLTSRCVEEFPQIIGEPYRTSEMQRLELYGLRDTLAEKHHFKKPQTAMITDDSLSKGSRCVFGPDCEPEFAFLDNRFQASFKYGGRIYSSAAAAYVAQKYSHRPDLMDQVATMEVEKVHWFVDYSAYCENSDAWSPKSEEYMLDILRAKFGQNDSIKQQLVSTGNSYLCFSLSEKKEDVFESGLFHDYSNRLGRFLMEVREENGGCGKVENPENFKQLMERLKIQ